MDLLVLLIEHRGQIVSREKIVERVWGKGVFLDTDNSINAAVRKIRQALKDDPERPRYVQTITGRGYRFVAQIIDPGPPVGEQPVLKQTAAPERLIGTKISHYRLLQVLGGGGMGVVYRAEDLKLGRLVAIKFLPGELASDPMAFARMEREGRAASALDHRNICSIYELGEYQGQPFIVMQLLEGQTIREWIEVTAGQSGSQRLRQLLDVAIQIADGLDAAHLKGIIHRDIKPANIFITHRGEAKILDFGVAKFLELPESPPAVAGSTQDSATPANPTLTITGASVGTPSYLSPEQIRGEKLDARTDLFSFGLVLYEMATGQRAFAGKTVTVIREAVLCQPAAPVRQLNPELPPKMEAIIAKALDKDRNRRFQSALELRTALEELRNGLEPAAKGSSGKRIWLVGGVAAIVLLACALYLINARQRLWRGTNPISSAGINPRRSVAVLGFKNLSGKPEEDWISTALAEMFSAELAAGQQLRTVPGENVARMKLDLSLPAADSYSRETLGKIGNQLSADLVVLGSYLAVGKDSGGKVRIDLQLQDSRAGETVAVISQDGTEADLADLVSRVGTGVRQTLGVGVANSGDALAVRASIPTNPQAARLYAEGLAKLRGFDALAARDLLEKAIAADPNHALSHSALAEAWSALGYDAKAQQQAKSAFDLSAGLSREERLSVEGRYRELTHDFASAIEIYRTLRNFFPDDLDYGLRLASAQLDADRGKDASETIARLRTLPPPESGDPRIDLMETHVGEAIGDFKRAQQLAAAAAGKGQLQGSRLIVAQAKEREGWAWGQLGESDRALNALSEARDLFAASGNPRSSAITLLDIADVWFDRGDYALARKSYEDALRVFREIGAQQKLAYTLSRMGSMFYQQGKLEEAKRYQEDALRVDREIGNGTERDMSNLANVLDAMGELTGAVQLWQQAAQGFHEQGDKSDEAITLTNLGGGFLRRGDIGLAKKSIEAAMAMQQEVSHKRGLGFSLLFLSEIQRAQDQLQDAQATTERNLVLRKELKDGAGIPETQLQLAEIAFEQGRNGEAESLARTAAASFDQQKVTDLGAQSYGDLARALLAQGKMHEAEVNANRATALSQQGGDLTARFEATLAAGAVNAALGKISDAAKALEAVRSETSRKGYVYHELEARLELGELELRSGQMVRGRARLQQLQNDAQAKGFLLIARQAAAALGDTTGHPRPN
jgi:serine/threonine protein kinase/tetratricopeptide (TPR) repeat protein